MAEMSTTSNGNDSVQVIKVIESSSKITNFSWLIDNFPAKSATTMKSCEFCMKSDPSMKWCMVFMRKKPEFCNHSDNCKLTFYSLGICVVSSGNNFPVPYNVQFSIEDHCKTKILSKTTKIANVEEDRNYGFQNFILEEELLTYLSPTNCLQIRLKITPPNVRNFIENHLSPTKKNFQSFLNNKAFSDVVFHFGNSEFPAHKIILVTASPVFERMFSNQTKENVTTKMEIKEADPGVFMEMLRYIYTGEIENLKSVALDLYHLAKVYDIKELRASCEECLLHNLSAENVIKILEIADSNNSTILKEKCIDYIDKYFDEVQKSEPFKTIKRELLVNLLCAIQVKKKEVRRDSQPHFPCIDSSVTQHCPSFAPALSQLSPSIATTLSQIRPSLGLHPTLKKRRRRQRKR